MKVTKVQGVHFKNYKKVEATFSEGCNIIYGANGSGKTNLLDLLHFLSLGKSYFSIPDKNAIASDAEFLRIEGWLKSNSDSHQITIAIPRTGRKKIKLNDSPLSQVTELLGLMPLVCIVPDDIELVKGTTSIRRKFMDRVLCQLDRSYTTALILYQKNLAQKVSYLKSVPNINMLDDILLESYNAVLVENALVIARSRSKFVEDFKPIFQSIYQDIAESKEKVTMDYISNVEVDTFKNDLSKSLENDYFSKRAQIGIHRDDLAFIIDADKSIRKYGSQGQIKTYIYALKLSEYLYLSQKSESKPILLLDDIFEKLDQERLIKLFELVTSDKFGQIFITDTELERSLSILRKLKIDYDSFKVAGGILTANNG